MEFYQAEKMSNHVTRITSLTGEHLYLIEGDNKAVLVDTNLGVGNLRAFVESLTTKPITVLLTHGHIDHAMGAPEFDDVYMNSKDNHIFVEQGDVAQRMEYIKMNLRDVDFKGEDLAFLTCDQPNFKELEDGMVFDLGGLHLKVYEAPGHTPGCMTILILEERTLIIGDACNPYTFLWDEHSLPVEAYYQSLLKLKERTAGLFDQVYFCHANPVGATNIIDEVMEVCEDIMNGKTDDIPFEFMGRTSYFAKAVDETLNRTDGRFGNIIYSKDKVFAGTR